MSKILSNTILIIIFILLMIFTYGCKSNEDKQTNSTSETVYIDPEENKVILEIANTVNKMYEYFNNKQFEDYLSFYDIDDTEKSNMLNNFQQTSGVFDTSCKIDNIVLVKYDDTNISATVVSISTSINSATNKTSVIKETTYYNFKIVENSEFLHIESYSLGESQLVSFEE